MSSSIATKSVLNNMPSSINQLFVQSHSVNLSTKNRDLFFAELKLEFKGKFKGN